MMNMNDMDIFGEEVEVVEKPTAKNTSKSKSTAIAKASTSVAAKQAVKVIEVTLPCNAYFYSVPYEITIEDMNGKEKVAIDEIREYISELHPQLRKENEIHNYEEETNNVFFSIKMSSKGAAMKNTLADRDVFDFYEQFRYDLPLIDSGIFNEFLKLARSMGEREVYADIYYDKTNERYFLDIPTQKAWKYRVDVTRSSKYLGSRFIHVADIHSHHVMNEPFSPRDDRDDITPILHILIYGLRGKKYSVLSRLGTMTPGVFVDIDPCDIFENIEEGEI